MLSSARPAPALSPVRPLARTRERRRKERIGASVTVLTFATKHETSFRPLNAHLLSQRRGSIAYAVHGDDDACHRPSSLSSLDFPPSQSTDDTERLSRAKLASPFLARPIRQPPIGRERGKGKIERVNRVECSPTFENLSGSNPVRFYEIVMGFGYPRKNFPRFSQA